MSLISHYKMNDDEANTDVIDSAGINNGTLNVNTNTKSVTGKINKALDFDGNFVLIPGIMNAETFDSNTKKTISLWFKSDINGQKMMFSTGQVGNDRFYAWTNGNIIAVQIGDNTVTTGFTITEGIWYYLTVVIDGLSADIYVNGDKKQTKTFTGFTTDDYLVLGQHGEAASFPFDGKIDDVRIYDVALTSDQIRAIYNNGRGTEIEVPPYIPNMMGANF